MLTRLVPSTRCIILFNSRWVKSAVQIGTERAARWEGVHSNELMLQCFVRLGTIVPPQDRRGEMVGASGHLGPPGSRSSIRAIGPNRPHHHRPRSQFENWQAAKKALCCALGSRQ